MKYSPELILKLLGDAELKDSMAQSTASRNWVTLVRLVAKLFIENAKFREEIHELQYEHKNVDLHLDALHAKIDRVLEEIQDGHS